MNEQSVTGMACLQRGVYLKSRLESGTGKKQYRYIASIVAIFLLLSISIFSASQCAAETDAQKAAIASGVAAGTDIAVIIKNAVASGMTTGQAVEAIILAGSDPGRVVYEAIAAKYPSESVIKGAAAAVNSQYCADTTQAPCSSRVCAIVAAATQAGETETQTRSWIASAGVPPIVLANASAQACQASGGAPVEGYSAPAAGVALTSIIGGGGGSIGGASIGSKNASRSTP